MEITWLGHATFLLEEGGTRVLIDPFLSGNPKAARQPDEVECDVILQTHGHVDHVFGAEELCRRTGAGFHIHAGDEPPIHTHTREDEWSFVLEGRVGLLIGDDHRHVACFADAGVDIAEDMLALARRHNSHGDHNSPIKYQLMPSLPVFPGERQRHAHHQATTRESPDTKLVAKWRYHSLQWHRTGWKVGVCRRFTAQPDPRWYAWTQ